MNTFGVITNNLEKFDLAYKSKIFKSITAIEVNFIKYVPLLNLNDVKGRIFDKIILASDYYLNNDYDAICEYIVDKAKDFALRVHSETNHKYDGRPYSVHLEMVYNYAQQYLYLLPTEAKISVLSSAWTHDTIEDCRQTYNDVKNVLGRDVAEITYALTNEKGKTRKERANSFYYQGIRETPYADYIKLCDRLANVKYSKENGSKMLDVYRKEYDEFKSEIFNEKHNDMWQELATMLQH